MINTKEIEEEKFIEEIRSWVRMAAEELRKIEKENDIKLLGLLRYLRKRNYRKARKEYKW